MARPEELRRLRIHIINMQSVELPGEPAAKRQHVQALSDGVVGRGKIGTVAGEVDRPGRFDDLGKHFHRRRLHGVLRGLSERDGTDLRWIINMQFHSAAIIVQRRICVPRLTGSDRREHDDSGFGPTVNERCALVVIPMSTSPCRHRPETATSLMRAVGTLDACSTPPAGDRCHHRRRSNSTGA